jgi:hypothetical protein
MDKNDDMEDGIRVQMDKFNLIMVKETAEAITGREANSALEERRKHHNLVCIGCGDILPDGGMPL